MTPTYLFQHVILRDLFLKTDPAKWKALIDARDGGKIDQIINACEGMLEKRFPVETIRVAHLTEFREIDGMNALLIRFHVHPDSPNCERILVFSEGGKVFFFTREYGEDLDLTKPDDGDRLAFFLCRWIGDVHTNYGVEQTPGDFERTAAEAVRRELNADRLAKEN